MSADEQFACVPATTRIFVDGVLMDIAGFEDKWPPNRLWDRALAVMETQ